MNAQKDCKGCKHFTWEEYWSYSGRSMLGYRKKNQMFVRYVKDCDKKE